MSTASEQPVWEGRPSQWTNFWWFAACLLVIPIPVAIWKYLTIRCTTYTLSSQRFRVSTGVLNRVYDDLELYRVKDITVSQPLVQRMLGLGTVRMVTSDATTPELTLGAIAEPLVVHDAMRAEVERCRRERGVRELDVHDDDGAALGR
jgi:uncharacterized membrane protein YdbT with pleckstrin-like domain